MIRVYGTHTKSKIKNWELGYEKLSKIFNKHLVQPKWYKEKYPDTEFSHWEYLIRGHPEKKASNPAFVCRIINGVLHECSNIRLLKKNETASWLQILWKGADDGNYVVFFKVQPFKAGQVEKYVFLNCFFNGRVIKYWETIDLNFCSYGKKNLFVFPSRM